MKALSGPIVDGVTTAPPRYDRDNEEPNLELVITSYRDESAPDAGSRWQLLHRVNGEIKPLNTVQADYAGALMRHGAYILLDSQALLGKTDVDRIVAAAKLDRHMAYLAMADFVSHFHALAEAVGVEGAALAFNFSREEAEFYLTFRPFLPRELFAQISQQKKPPLRPVRALLHPETTTKTLSDRLPGGWNIPKRKERKRRSKRKKTLGLAGKGL